VPLQSIQEDIKNGHGFINPSPANGVEVNEHFLDTINDYGMEQLVSDPTRNDHILDLVLITQPEMLKGVTWNI